MVDVRFNEVFGRNLRQYRESFEMPRYVFASKYGGSTSTLQSYEAGKRCPNFQRFLQICNTFEISPNILLKGLYSWRTEADTIEKLAAVNQSLDNARMKKVKGFQDLYIEESLRFQPSLAGADFATRLHLLRVSTGYDAATVAGRCMLARPTLQGYESGQYDPSVPAALRFCEIVGVTPEYLFAPKLTKLSYVNTHFVDLYPQQIEAMLRISEYMIRTLD